MPWPCRSPRLDKIGNSVRAVEAYKELVKRFSFHNFELFSGLSAKKIDPTKEKNEAEYAALGGVLFAASNGDLSALTNHYYAGVDLYGGNYDARTALHLAAAEGHSRVVRFLIEKAPDTPDALSPRDRWGGTPLNDARGFNECSKLLREAGAKEGIDMVECESIAPEAFDHDSADAPKILFPASEGDVDELIQLAARGVDLFVYDYDLRTALHLAASEGHLPVLKYLVTQAKRRGKLCDAMSAKDRWGNTPLDDAHRANHKECEEFIKLQLTPEKSKRSRVSTSPGNLTGPKSTDPNKIVKINITGADALEKLEEATT